MADAADLAHRKTTALRAAVGGWNRQHVGGLPAHLPDKLGTSPRQATEVFALFARVHPRKGGDSCARGVGSPAALGWEVLPAAFTPGGGCATGTIPYGGTPIL